jgi:hypothetical protein
MLSPDLAAEDTAKIFVSDGGDFVELYDPTAGDYVSGYTGIVLTADNCGLGVVPAGSTVPFIMRLNPPSGRTIALNQRIFSIRIFSEGL